jgi:aminomethyltransferase
MPRPTPFHARTSALCTSLLYKEWAGCYAVKRYDVYVDREYYALRHQATLMDATPLYKYELRGRDACALVSRVMVRGFEGHKTGRVSYVCWCDEHGKVLDDGTVTKLAEYHFRVTSADPALAWLERQARGLDVSITDVSRSLAALALQGPRSRDVLRSVVGKEIDGLRFFRAMPVRFPIARGAAGGPGFDGWITRTGYTGDLGYELWCANEHALALWDAVMEAGAPHGLLPMGLDALDVVRVEAGFVLGAVDYTSARIAFIERQKSTPFELGFDWMVEEERAGFIGAAALRAERAAGPTRRLVGLEIDWDAYEALHAGLGLVPHLATETSREGVPVYDGGRQVGYATSRTFSPTLKKYLALAHVSADLARPGTELAIEATCEYERHTVPARVTKTPFLDLERKKA